MRWAAARHWAMAAPPCVLESVLSHGVIYQTCWRTYMPRAPGGCQRGRVLVKRLGWISSSWVSSRTSSMADWFCEGPGGLMRVGWEGMVVRGEGWWYLRRSSGGNVVEWFMVAYTSSE